ncbi:MAG TPA: M4 family metallopeptidase [Bacteroidia bacterium]|nr:M4 family metallopeptidase [Bacteroidia bacterium]HNU32003.1 M4 family metallopeptidase [Bacteroidia bacterium]
MNKKIKLSLREILFSCTGALLSLTAIAQNRQMQMEEFAKPVETKGWIDFREGNTLNPQTLFTEKKEMFGLTAYDDMQQYKVQSDEIGFTHFRFQQYHKGIKIIGAETILHHNGQYLKSMNGQWAENLDLNVSNSIDEQTAFENAKSSLQNVQYFIWEHPELADVLSKNSNGQKDFSKPKGQLVICRKNTYGNFTSDNLNLAYYFRMVVLPSTESKDIYVDAVTGEIMSKVQLAVECNNNTGNTSWYGSKTFTAAYFGWPNNNWFLEAQCTGEARIRSRRGDPILPYNYGDANGAWTDPDGTNGYNMRAGVTTFFGMRKTYDYFKLNHNRLSYNNSNGTVDAYSEILGGLWNTVDNAKWDPIYNAMFFGAGATGAATDDINSIDIVGHEFTHGVVQYSAGLVYQGESGALNESFADIFGECIEFYSVGMMDWINGLETGDPVRDYANPNAYSQPDTYMGDFWYPPSGSYDNGGVHINSGVQNFWFYLLTLGGSGTNDTNQTYNVTGIGLTKAAQITYRNLNNYLTSASNYFDAREGSLRAATDLFGWCSNEVLQTARAWYAVGVARTCPDWDYIVPCGNLTSGINYRGVNSISNNNTCTTTLASGANAMFSATATGGITLKPGFTATQGCAFTAAIDACNEAAYNKLSFHHQQNASQNTEPTVPIKIHSLFPNPANNKVTIQFESSSDVSEIQLSIVDISGRIVHLKPYNMQQYQSMKTALVDVKNFNSGIYFIYIRDKNSTVNHKLVISQ